MTSSYIFSYWNIPRIQKRTPLLNPSFPEPITLIPTTTISMTKNTIIIPPQLSAPTVQFSFASFPYHRAKEQKKKPLIPLSPPLLLQIIPYYFTFYDWHYFINLIFIFFCFFYHRRVLKIPLALNVNYYCVECNEQWSCIVYCYFYFYLYAIYSLLLLWSFGVYNDLYFVSFSTAPFEWNTFMLYTL